LLGKSTGDISTCGCNMIGRFHNISVTTTGAASV
jgi:hypothetical protein